MLFILLLFILELVSCLLQLLSVLSLLEIIIANVFSQSQILVLELLNDLVFFDELHGSSLDSIIILKVVAWLGPGIETFLKLVVLLL